MAILNFNFNKILVERTGKASKQMNIKSGMNITDVISSDVVKGTGQKAYAIKFTFEVNYEPKVAQILLEGAITYLADETLGKEIEETWAKNKLLPKSITLNVFNRILHNCNVEALILSKELSLPAPIQLPKVKMAENTQAPASKDDSLTTEANK
ncbi:hypothetical protein K9M74_00515 [Candidatus Woesearchaeota archaeon]|nr:hypothetical protein [Candidatus Woesearchaeota archaeon]